jgi:protein-disulfide isomerase
MPSGKRSRQQRREAQRTPPPVRSKGGGTRTRQASPKVLASVAAVVVVAVVGIVLGVVLTRGGSSTAANVPTYGSLANGLPGAAEVNRLFTGIPQQGNVLGKATAPVTMVEYVDLQCPYCQQFETQVMPNLLKKYVRPGKVKVEVRPIAFIGPDSVTGRDAMIAAGEQNKAFQFAELLYFNQQTENTGWLSQAMIQQAASSIPGLNVPKLLADQNSSSVQKQAQSYDALQNSDNVTSTPTLFVGKSGAHGTQVQMASATDEQSVTTAITNALGG